MFELRQRSVSQKVLGSKITLVVLVCIVILLGRAAFRVYLKYLDAEKNVARSTKELASLTEEQTALSASVSKLKTEQGIEDEIRRKFQVTKNGESLIVIVDDGTKDTAALPVTDSGGWWESTKSFFGFK